MGIGSNYSGSKVLNHKLVDVQRFHIKHMHTHTHIYIYIYVCVCVYMNV